MLAEVKRDYKFSQLLNYDKFFRSYAARNFADHTIWWRKNEDAFLEFLDTPKSDGLSENGFTAYIGGDPIY